MTSKDLQRMVEELNRMNMDFQEENAEVEGYQSECARVQQDIRELMARNKQLKID